MQKHVYVKRVKTFSVNGFYNFDSSYSPHPLHDPAIQGFSTLSVFTPFIREL